MQALRIVLLVLCCAASAAAQEIPSGDVLREGDGWGPEWVEIVDWVVEGCTSQEKRKLFRDNAIRTYRL